MTRSGWGLGTDSDDRGPYLAPGNTSAAGTSSACFGLLSTWRNSADNSYEGSADRTRSTVTSTGMSESGINQE